MACFSKSGLIGTQHVHSFILFLWLLLCYFCVTDVTYVAFMTALNHHDYDHLACLFIGKIFTSFILIIHKEIRFMTTRTKILGQSICPGLHQCMAAHPSDDVISLKISLKPQLLERAQSKGLRLCVQTVTLELQEYF